MTADSQNTQLTVYIKNAEGGYPSLHTGALSLQLWLTAFKAHANLGENNLIKAEFSALLPLAIQPLPALLERKGNRKSEH